LPFLDNPILPPKQALSEIKEFHSPLKIAQRVKTIKTIIFSLKEGKILTYLSEFRRTFFLNFCLVSDLAQN